MKKTDNKEMLNAIREQASAEYQEKVPVMMDDAMVRALPTKLDSYPTIKNEFIQTLINKVVRTDFFSKVYENPLKMLKKGTLPYGASIEELFVLAAEGKGFYGNNFDNADHTGITQGDVNELLSIKAPKVKSLYITKNFAHFFKTSISDAQLKGAFNSQNGLSELVNQITASLVNGAEQEEYQDMKNLIKAVAQVKRIKTDGAGHILENPDDMVDIPQGGGATGESITNQAGLDSKDGVKQVIAKYKVDTTVSAGKGIAKAIRSLAGRLKFVSSEYNMAGVKTFTRPEDLVFLTTPEIMATIDVDVLATAFNVAKTDVNVRTILVDELPTKWSCGKPGGGELTKRGMWTTDAVSHRRSETVGTGSDGNCLGILMDKDFIQAWDTVNEARQFENGRVLTTNLFLHRQGILANCYFANCVALFDETGYNKVKAQ